MFKAPIPILRIFDIEKAKKFYIDYLGFHMEWEHRFEEDFPIYMQISLSGCTIHLSEHHGDCSPGAAVRIEATGLEEYVSSLKKKGYKYLNPKLGKTPWQTLELELLDPFGNRIIFCQSI